MHPTARIPLLGINVQSHDLMVSLAVVVAAALGAYWTVRREGLPAGRVVLALVAIAVVTLAGGRLHFVLANLPHLRDPLASAARLSSGSLHAPGAIVGAAIGAIVVLRILGLPLARFADGLAPAVGLGIAVARTGCLLHGCCYGMPSDVPWAVALSSSSYVYAVHLERGLLPPDASASLAVHPLPAYFAATGIAITLFLLWLRHHKRYDGQLALTLIFLFSASSALLEPLRIDDPMRVYWGPAPQLLWVNAALAVVSGTALAWARQRRASPQFP